ncbi:DUF2178 domain-containing protein [Methanolacinia paynteri]|uniref:DUF2178 domain-containing protein n=1 Tax=Methanolacinia paynteri TaxID=230356 RepID=UPI00064E7766|nr:DUF2178 domain-containing protein [Methanolacinia paynteri]
MRKKEYHLCMLGIIAGTLVAVYFGIISGNLLVPGVIIIAGIVLVWLCQRKVTDVITDDLSDMIHGKAALKTLEFMIVVLVIFFIATTTFYWSGGWGFGMHTYDNGSVRITFLQFYPGGYPIYEDNYYFVSTPALTVQDINGLEDFFVKGHNVRNYPYVIGAALGFVAVLLVLIFTVFSLYYSRKYGCTEDEKQD